LSSTGCRAANPCIIRDYVPTWASGDEAAPIINVVGDNSAFSFTNSGDAMHDEGYRVLNIDAEGSGAGSGVTLGNDVKDVTFCNMTFNGFDLGFYVAWANMPGPGSDGKNARIVLRGSRITNNEMGYLGACNGCSIEYNYFDQDGGGDPSVHAIYMEDAETQNSAQVSTPYLVSGETIIGNEIDNSAPAGQKCSGVALVVHGQHTNMLIAGNTIKEDAQIVTGGCYGISVTSGYTRLEYFSNVVISGNTIINPGEVGIQTTICSNCTIENNLILSGASRSIGIGWGNPLAPHSAQDPGGTAGVIRNNTIYFDNAGQGGTGVLVAEEGTGHVVANNAIFTTTVPTSDKFGCLKLPLPPASYAFVDNNACSFPSGSNAFWELNSSSASLAAWQTAGGGFDKHSISRALKLTMPALANFDFSPAAGSPLIRAGDTAHASATDLTGKTRPSQPDIGALQNGVPVPAVGLWAGLMLGAAFGVLGIRALGRPRSGVVPPTG
jgi:parallel beta-helix repeat protein